MTVIVASLRSEAVNIEELYPLNLWVKKPDEVNEEKVTLLAGRPRRDRLPRNRQRERLLQMVRDHDGAVDAVEFATQMDCR